jgi:hypothetical protein
MAAIKAGRAVAILISLEIRWIWIPTLEKIKTMAYYDVVNLLIDKADTYITMGIQ